MKRHKISMMFNSGLYLGKNFIVSPFFSHSGIHSINLPLVLRHYCYEEYNIWYIIYKFCNYSLPLDNGVKIASNIKHGKITDVKCSIPPQKK
jgi:hypothetical protein